MSLGLQFQLKDDATPAFQRLAAAVRTQPTVRAAMGQAIGKKLRDNFRRLDRERANPVGGRRSHFYGRAVKAVQQPVVTADGVSVSIVQAGLAQRFFGGTIVAGQNGSGKKFLTLPVHPEAYNQRARDIAGLEFIPLDGGRRAILARPNPDSPTGIGEVFYALVRRVHQEADPEVLPSDADLQSAAVAAGEAQLATLIDRNRA